VLDWPDVDKLLLTGGSTLMPLVRRRVLEASRLSDESIVQEQPHRAVAYGAILVAERELGSGSSGVPPLVQRIATRDLGMRVWDREKGGPGVQTLIQRNCSLPATHTSVFYTTRPDQTRLVFELVQSKTDDEEGSSLGHFSFGPIAAPRKNYPVEYDLDGLVHVTARDPRTGNAMEHRVEDRSRVDASELEKARELVMSQALNP
jgi:molecular chaperone DnaK